MTGAVVAAAHTPDLEETYLSTIILSDAGTSSPTILFGTGGETRKGGFWKTTLDDVLAGDISGATLLLEGEQKGVIAPPALGDLDGEGRLDIVVSTFDGRLIAFNGTNDDVLWELDFDGSETFSTPTLGYFDDDDRAPSLVTARSSRDEAACVIREDLRTEAGEALAREDFREALPEIWQVAVPARRSRTDLRRAAALVETKIKVLTAVERVEVGAVRDRGRSVGRDVAVGDAQVRAIAELSRRAVGVIDGHERPSGLGAFDRAFIGPNRARTASRTAGAAGRRTARVARRKGAARVVSRA